MLLTAKVINPDASLNNFTYYSSAKFIPNSTFTFAVQLFDADKKMRYIPPSTAVITFTFNNSDFTTFTQAATFIDPGDRSLLLVSLSSTQTALLVGGNLTFVVDVLGNGTDLINGVSYNTLSYIDTTI